MICICDDGIRKLYLRSQTPLDKQGVDYWNSDKRAVDWVDLMLEKFNGSDTLVTDIVPDLHEKFREEISCPKGLYQLTRKKCTLMLQEGKGKLRKIIRRYNLSGNGSDMATFDEDTDVVNTCDHFTCERNTCDSSTCDGSTCEMRTCEN